MLTQGWDAVDVLTEFRKRRGVRPNDHFLEQVVELDNELRKERVFGIPRTIKLNRLSDIPCIPKPWHYEFWSVIPEADSVPFKLTHFGEQRPDMWRKRPKNDLEECMDESKTYSEASEKGDEQKETKLSLMEIPVDEKRLSTCSSRSGGDWEWEYYSDDEDEDDKPVKKAISKSDTESNLFQRMVGSASEWKQVSSQYGNRPSQIKEEVETKKKPADGVFVPTTDKQLRIICWRTKPWESGEQNPKLFCTKFAMMWKVDCDEVYPGLFIGDAAAATHVKFLKHLNVTHVLNTAEGDDEGLVNLNQAHYEGSGITYMGIHMWDNAWFDVRPFLEEATDFIESAFSSGGKILVNCQMGVSRSSTCAIAYMMMKLGWRATDTLKLFRQRRDVRPNDGFLKILANLDNELTKKRLGL